MKVRTESLCRYLRQRRYRLMAAALLFLAEMALLVWPAGWLGEENAVSAGKVLRALFLSGLTACGAAFGLPEDRRVRRGAGILLLVAGPYFLGQRLELLTAGTEYLSPVSLMWNICLMLLLEGIVLLCTCSLRLSVCLSNVFLTLLYSANYYVYSFRGAPLRMNDLLAAGTAAGVAGGYSLRPNSHLAFAWSMALLLLVFGMQTGAGRRTGKSRGRTAARLASFCGGVLLLFFCGHLFLDTDFFVRAGFEDIHGIDQLKNYQYNGYLVASMMDIRASRVVKPEGYSVERAEELLAAAEGGAEEAASGRMPHIILVMNESFSDLRVLGNLQISRENMPFFYSLKENTIRGQVNASVLGGGTANSEFEVFTGCSMGLLPASSYPYLQYMVRPVPSMVSNLKDAGYTAYSIHPAPAGNWHRGRIYQYLGFDDSFWGEDFHDFQGIHMGISDLDTYEMVEELFEKREAGEKLFLFNLTIQNHGGYKESNVERSVAAVNVSSEEADIYLSAIYESDKAFEQLITYFEGQEEPVLICMFGDHQPKILETSFYEGIYGQTEGLEERDKIWNQHKTPFVIWANYDIPEQEGLDIGMSYLGALVMETAGVPGSPFFSFLRQYREEYPVITVNGYKDNKGQYHDFSGDGSELTEYRILQYNYLFDRKMAEWGF